MGQKWRKATVAKVRVRHRESMEKVDRIPRYDHCQILFTVTVPCYHFCASYIHELYGYL